MDERALLERLAERIPEPLDVMEGLHRRRAIKQRNARLRAGGVAFALIAVLAVLAYSALRDRDGESVPVTTPSETGPVVTFDLDPDDDVGRHHFVSVNGVPLDGTSDHPKSPPGTPETELDFRYVWAPTIELPAGTRIEVEGGKRGWVDVHDLSETTRLYELDLGGSPSVPSEPGTYYLEFSIPNGGDDLIMLFPVRVVAPDDA